MRMHVGEKRCRQIALAVGQTGGQQDMTNKEFCNAIVFLHTYSHSFARFNYLLAGWEQNWIKTWIRALYC